jgi:hypothetical protein
MSVPKYLGLGVRSVDDILPFINGIRKGGF